MGLSAWDSPHQLAIRSRSVGDMSTPHNLPWENAIVPDEMEFARNLDLIEGDMIFDDQ